MIENLLWPKKLSMPPQLLINPSELFKGFLFQGTYPLVNSVGDAATQIRFIETNTDRFRIGFVSDVHNAKGLSKKVLTLPFQEISTEIYEYKCHGWNKKGKDTLSTPDKTEVKKSINSAKDLLLEVWPMQANNSSSNRYLFKMEGDALEGNGSGSQFLSKGTYSGIKYQISGDELRSRLSSEFPNMWNAFSDATSKTLAFEVVVDVHVVSTVGSDGFKVGLTGA